METKSQKSVTYYLNGPSLYSLEKLIEWKLSGGVPRPKTQRALYSLEKLIEWKRLFSRHKYSLCLYSLLAREIN